MSDIVFLFGGGVSLAGVLIAMFLKMRAGLVSSTTCNALRENYKGVLENLHTDVREVREKQIEVLTMVGEIMGELKRINGQR